MIRRIFCALVACVMLMGSASALRETRDFVRLHVIAADDTAEMQALKLELRDTCLKCAEACLYDAPDADAAYRLLQAHVRDFEAACVSRARELGYAGSVYAETGIFDFPDRIYGKLRVPAGEYRALRVTVGAGEGHNWWCVLYPSLCKIDEADAGGMPDAAGALRWLAERLGWKR